MFLANAHKFLKCVVCVREGIRAGWLVTHFLPLIHINSTKSCNTHSTRIEPGTSFKLTSSLNQPRNHDLASTNAENSHLIPSTKQPSGLLTAASFPYLVTGYYSVHPRKGRVVLSQFPFVLWASSHWLYERTLYSRRPLP